jgi:hypothetical protein
LEGDVKGCTWRQLGVWPDWGRLIGKGEARKKQQDHNNSETHSGGLYLAGEPQQYYWLLWLPEAR